LSSLDFLISGGFTAIAFCFSSFRKPVQHHVSTFLNQIKQVKVRIPYDIVTPAITKADDRLCGKMTVDRIP
jgi:hypothetical protein